MQVPWTLHVPATTGTSEPPKVPHQCTKPARSSLLPTICAVQEVWPWQQTEAGEKTVPWQVPCINPEPGGICGGGVTGGQEPVQGMQARPREAWPPGTTQL